MGTAAVFSVNDLPVAAGDEALEFAFGAPHSGAANVLRVETFADRLEAAADRREAMDDYQEKLEKYEESLKEYEEKLEKFIEEQDGKNGEDKKNGSMARQKGEKKKEEEKKEVGTQLVSKRSAGEKFRFLHFQVIVNKRRAASARTGLRRRAGLLRHACERQRRAVQQKFALRRSPR